MDDAQAFLLFLNKLILNIQWKYKVVHWIVGGCKGYVEYLMWILLK